MNDFYVPSAQVSKIAIFHISVNQKRLFNSFFGTLEDIAKIYLVPRNSSSTNPVLHCAGTKLLQDLNKLLVDLQHVLEI
jgi:hypothetical protein